MFFTAEAFIRYMHIFIRCMVYVNPGIHHNIPLAKGTWLVPTSVRGMPNVLLKFP